MSARSMTEGLRGERDGGESAASNEAASLAIPLRRRAQCDQIITISILLALRVKIRASKSFCKTWL